MAAVGVKGLCRLNSSLEIAVYTCRSTSLSIYYSPNCGRRPRIFCYSNIGSMPLSKPDKWTSLECRVPDKDVSNFAIQYNTECRGETVAEWHWLQQCIQSSIFFGTYMSTKYELHTKYIPRNGKQLSCRTEPVWKQKGRYKFIVGSSYGHRLPQGFYVIPSPGRRRRGCPRLRSAYSMYSVTEGEDVNGTAKFCVHGAVSLEQFATNSARQQFLWEHSKGG